MDTSRFTFARIAGLAIFGGLAVGAVGASFTVGHARLNDYGVQRSASYADLVGNRAALASAADYGAEFCETCRDTYDIAYDVDPDRPRVPVRVAQRGWAADAEQFVIPEATGWTAAVRAHEAAIAPDAALAHARATMDAALASTADIAAADVRVARGSETAAAPITIAALTD